MITMSTQRDPVVAATRALLRGCGLVVAGAGAGKSTLIERVVERLVLGKGVPADGVLAVTFARGAAAELASRLARAPDRQLAPVWCSTLHALGLYWLTRWRSVRTDVLNEADAAEFVATCRGRLSLHRRRGLPSAATCSETFAGAVGHAHDLAAFDSGAALALYVQRFRPRLVPTLPSLYRLWRAYQADKRHQHVLDFGDMIVECLRGLQTDEEAARAVQHQHRYIIVDEGQDLTRLQLELLRLVAGPDPHLLLVTDDAQTIFSFAGASHGTPFEFQREHGIKDGDVIRLETCYRATRSLVALGQAVLNSMPHKFAKRLRADPAHPGPVVKPLLVKADDPTAEARWVADEIERLLSKGLELGHIAVLYRNRAHGDALRAELSDRELKVAEVGGGGLLASVSVRDVLAVLRCARLLDDSRAALRTLLLVPHVGSKEAQAVERRRADQSLATYLPHHHARNGSAQVRLRRLARVLQATAGSDLATATKRAVTYYLRHSKHADAGGHADLLALVETARLSRSLGTLLADLEAEAANPFGGGGRSTRRDAITLSTIHGAKGGQRRAVFLIGAADGQLPLHGLNVDAEEERRLAYVAVTRAEVRLYVSWPASEGPLSPFFAEPAVEKRFRRRCWGTAANPA